jgi:hypothetical protein
VEWCRRRPRLFIAWPGLCRSPRRPDASPAI